MRVSVVVPVYNAEKFLEKAVQSVVDQSHKDIELILVDDGSKDGSHAKCLELARMDSRIKVVFQENKGPAAARNTGILHTSGELLFFLDADDFIETTAIETLLLCWGQSRPEMVMGNFRKLENNGAVINQRVPLMTQGRTNLTT